MPKQTEAETLQEALEPVVGAFGTMAVLTQEMAAAFTDVQKTVSNALLRAWQLSTRHPDFTELLEMSKEADETQLPP